MRKIYSALDIGSNSIKLVVGEFVNNKLNVLCAIDSPSKGFKRNEITNPEDLMDSVKVVIDKAYEKLNIKIKRVILNIPTNYNNFIVTEATNTITNEELTVNSGDILRVLQTSAYNKVSESEELLAVVPAIFKVGDNETNEPFQKRGKTLSVKSVLVTTEKKMVYDLINLLSKIGVETIDVTTTGLVDYYSFKNKELDKGNGIIINLGDTTTSLSVINKGIYINNEVLDCGGYDISKDIAFIYKLRKKDADYLKEHLALAISRNADPKETCVVTNKEGEELTINQYELTEVVSSRLSEILKLTKNTINHLTKKEISYIIITGGLTEIKDFSVILNNIYGDNAKIGRINSIGVRHNKYSVAMGMLYYFNNKLSLRNKDYSTVSEEEEKQMCNTEGKSIISDGSILGKVFGYFFDN